MPDDALTETVKRFLADHIVSVEQLEILLLLSDTPERYWSVDEVFQTIQSSRSSVTERLANLQSQGFLKLQEGNPSRYQFKPATIELFDGVEALRTAYRQRRVKIIEAIFSPPMDQVRIFAEAFKLRKDK